MAEQEAVEEKQTLGTVETRTEIVAWSGLAKFLDESHANGWQIIGISFSTWERQVEGTSWADWDNAETTPRKVALILVKQDISQLLQEVASHVAEEVMNPERISHEGYQLSTDDE